MEATEKTQTRVFIQEGRVVIQHDKPVGTQYLTPQQARDMARGLEQAALMVETAGN